ncbi:MAG: helix-turn-helix transcriptional regulator [Firmicutes bacterium]|nr:helix-turn-helix transcriptional regulator [Bacillota bacterium]
MHNNLRNIGLERSLTQEELAVAAGITRPYLSDIEWGKKMPGGSVVLRLANACGVSVEGLFFLEAVNHNEQVASEGRQCDESTTTSI